MTDLTRTNLDSLAVQIGLAAKVLVGLAAALRGWLLEREGQYRQAEVRRLRAARLAAYRQRRRWKASDRPKLEKPAPSAAARRRMERAKGRGRPVVRNYVFLAEDLRYRAEIMSEIFDPATCPSRRLRLLKGLPWWGHFVEAVYRGELAAARDSKMRDAAGYARDVTSKAFRTNREDVKKAVAATRADRRLNGHDEGPAMRAADLLDWSRTGELPQVSSQSGSASARQRPDG